jgi:hypothetical protein
MDATERLKLPFLASGQAQKHTTLNEALVRLDGIIQLSVDGTGHTPPAEPSAGACHVLASSGSGAWDGGWSGDVAIWDEAGWRLAQPSDGWIAYFRDEGRLRIYDGSDWIPVESAMAGVGPAAERNVGVLDPDDLPSRADADVRYGRLAQDNTWAGLQIASAFQATGTDAALWFDARGGEHASAWYASDGFSRLWIGSLGDALTVRVSDGRVQIQGAVCPAADDATPLGTSGLRFSTVYAATDTINTSDADEKTPLSPLPQAALRAAHRLIEQVGIYQWLSAISEKGSSGARLHVGLTAQSVEEAFLREGLDAERWALFCRDLDEDGRPRLDLRQDQILMLMIVALNRASPSPTAS